MSLDSGGLNHDQHLTIDPPTGVIVDEISNHMAFIRAVEPNDCIAGKYSFSFSANLSLFRENRRSAADEFVLDGRAPHYDVKILEEDGRDVIVITP